MQIITMFFIGLFVVGVLIQVLTYRKEKAVKPKRIFISQSAAFLSMAVFSLITFRPPGPLWWVILLSVGFGGGIIYGSFVNMRTGGKGVTMSYTLPWLLTWGALMTITQLSSVLFRTVPVIIYGLAILNLGINIGMNARILINYRTLAGVATAGLALALVLVPSMAADAQEGYDTALPEVMEGQVDDLSVEVLGAGGITGDCINTVFQNDTGESVKVLIPVGTRLLPETPSTQIMVTAGNELLDVTPGQSEFLVKGFCSLHSAGAPGTGERFSFYEMADEDMRQVLLNILEAGAFDYTGQQALWYVTDGGDLETMDPAARALIPDGFDGTPMNTAEDYAAVGSDIDPSQYTIDPNAPLPLNPIQSGAAVGLSSLILALGSLIQLSDKLDPTAILEALKGLTSEIPGSQPHLPPTHEVPDALAGLPRSEDGRVFMRVPWDEAGEAWVTAEEAEQTLRMQSQGYKWDNRWGWVTDTERSQYNAVNEANREYNRQQDPELARIGRQIQLAREQKAAQEAYFKRMAETAARREELRAQIEAQTAETERLMEDVSSAEWQYRAVAGVGMVADMTVAGVANFVTVANPALGPLAQGLRAGYNMAKGVGYAVGENMVGITEIDPSSIQYDPLTGEVIKENLKYVTRHSFNGSDLARGVKYGVVNTAVDFTLDAAGRAVFKQPQLWKELASAPPVPPSLLVPKAAAQQLLAGVDDVAAKGGVAAAAKGVDQAAILKLYEKNGMQDFAKLESLGQLSKNQVAVMNKVLAENVDGAVTEAAKSVAKEWDSAASGVRLERLVIGDSGSSAGKAMKAASALTDNDKAVIAIFNPDDLAKEAARRGITPAELYEQLNKQATESCAGKVKLPGQLTAEDAKLGFYSGMGKKAGPTDSYPKNFTEMRMAVQGKGTVVEASGTAYKTSGEAVVDQSRLMQSAVGEPVSFANPSFPVSEFPSVAAKQVEALAKTAVDPKTAAKAMDRLLQMTERSAIAETGITANPQLAKMARAIVSEPQMDKGYIAYLAKHGYTPDEFATALQNEGGRIAEHIQRVAPTLMNK
ncbi:MAG: hypothetical protein JXA36_05620 [Coriobacteriia bacterium]|nr:hypothetical protein [Coriobacteriia bacterium]